MTATDIDAEDNVHWKIIFLPANLVVFVFLDFLIYFQCKIIILYHRQHRHRLRHRHRHVCLNHVKISLKKKLINKQKEIFHQLNKEEIRSEKKPKVGINKHAVFAIFDWNSLCYEDARWNVMRWSLKKYSNIFKTVGTKGTIWAQMSWNGICCVHYFSKDLNMFDRTGQCVWTIRTMWNYIPVYWKVKRKIPKLTWTWKREKNLLSRGNSNPFIVYWW